MGGLIHVYYGNGKGKTTAALGLIVRSSGCGNNCVLLQFLKDSKCGELVTLANLPNVTVIRGKAGKPMFVKDMTPQELEETKQLHNENFDMAVAKCDAGGLIVFDELLDALALKLIDENKVKDFLENKPEGLEVVITGHYKIDWLFENADYITEMVKHRHPYDEGIMGRRGVEF